ncbi:MAG: ZIP family metal transporter, partial [Acutalibacteraceae bacterium]
MKVALITAMGVGGATVFGAMIGFLFKNISHKVNDMILGFASGIMLAAAVVGLILPSIEYGGKHAVIV